MQTILEGVTVFFLTVEADDGFHLAINFDKLSICRGHAVNNVGQFFDAFFYFVLCNGRES